MNPDLRRNLAVLVTILVAVVAGIVYFGRRSDARLGPTDAADSATVEQRIEALRARLHELRVAQDTFHRHYGIYGRSVGQMRFEVPSEMTIEIVNHSAQGWAAQGLVRGSSRLCAIFVGDSARWVFPPAQKPGVPACTR